MYRISLIAVDLFIELLSIHIYYQHFDSGALVKGIGQMSPIFTVL